MSDPVRKVYWDSSCFICFLNKDEHDRRRICEDILHHASDGEIEIYYSMWVVVEVIRPKKPGNEPLPKWAIDAIKAVPEAQKHLEELWARYQRQSPVQKLTAKQIGRIQDMFKWPFLKPIYIEQRVADKAVEIARDTNMRPGDAIHAAAAVLAHCGVIQRWDRDYSKVAHLIPSEEPARMSPQGAIDFPDNIGPVPEDFEDEKATEAAPGAVEPQVADLRRGDNGRAEG